MFEESALIFSESRGIRGIWNLKKVTYLILELSLSDFEVLTVSLPNCDQNVKIQQNLQISFGKMRTKNSMKVKNDHRNKFFIGKFTAMIILDFHLQSQFKNELFHIFTSENSIIWNY